MLPVSQSMNLLSHQNTVHSIYKIIENSLASPLSPKLHALWTARLTNKRKSLAKQAPAPNFKWLEGAGLAIPKKITRCLENETIQDKLIS